MMERKIQMMLAGGAVVATIGFVPAHAGDPDYTVTTVVKRNTVIEGHGTVGTPSDVNVNNNGFWAVTVPLTNPSGGAILTPDGVHLAVGDEIADGVVISSLTNAYKGLNIHGDIAHRPSLVDLNSAFILNHTPLIMHNQISQAEGLSEDTPYTGFFRGRINDDRRMFLVATVNDSELPGTVHRVLMWLDYDEKTESLTETLLYKRHDHLPGQPKGVEANEFGTGSPRFDINNNGDAIFTVGFTGGDAATNAAIYINNTLVAQKGDSGPLKDATYNLGTSDATRVNINDNGEYIFLAPLAGGPTATNQVIMRNTLSNKLAGGVDEIVIRKGDPVPGLPDRTIVSLGTGAQPIITDSGQVVWYAQFDGDSATNHGVFVDDRLVLQKGVSETSDGDLITTVVGTAGASNGLANAMEVSPNGKYIIVRTMLNNLTTETAAVLVEFEDVEPKCAPADLNCDGAVDVQDLLILLGAWGPCEDPCPPSCVGDLNEDCSVDVQDLLILLSNWGPTN